MKSKSIYLICAIALNTIILSCSSPNSANAVADPEGTVSQNINFTINPLPISIYYGLAADGIFVPCSYCHTYPYVEILFGMNSSEDFYFSTTARQAATYSYYDDNAFSSAEIADIGAVSGLGAVTQKPSSGWVTSCAVTAGDGYVIRYKKSVNYSDSALTFYYARWSAPLTLEPFLRFLD
jgi:hypothetical protein